MSLPLKESERTLGDVPRKILKCGQHVDRNKLAEDSAAEIGQALDWAIDQSRTNKGALATDMGYSDASALARWVAGKERVQLDKLRVGNRRVYVEFLLTLLGLEADVEVKTQVTMRRAV